MSSKAMTAFFKFVPNYDPTDHQSEKVLTLPEHMEYIPPPSIDLQQEVTKKEKEIKTLH
jgi:hypothetical protein